MIHRHGGALAYGNPSEPVEMGSGPILALFASEDRARALLDAEYAAPGALHKPNNYIANGDLIRIDLPGGVAWAVMDI